MLWPKGLLELKFVVCGGETFLSVCALFWLLLLYGFGLASGEDVNEPRCSVVNMDEAFFASGSGGSGALGG